MSSPRECPGCGYALLQPKSTCPYCGTEITAPVWKKTAAWILLLGIIYFFVKCNLEIMQGLDRDIF